MSACFPCYAAFGSWNLPILHDICICLQQFGAGLSCGRLFASCCWLLAVVCYMVVGSCLFVIFVEAVVVVVAVVFLVVVTVVVVIVVSVVVAIVVTLAVGEAKKPIKFCKTNKKENVRNYQNQKQRNKEKSLRGICYIFIILQHQFVLWR